MSYDHMFTTLFLKETLKEIRKLVPREEMEKAWGWVDRRGYGEFHGPNNFFWYGNAKTVTEAKAIGWSKYLQKISLQSEEEE